MQAGIGYVKVCKAFVLVYFLKIKIQNIFFFYNISRLYNLSLLLNFVSRSSLKLMCTSPLEKIGKT